jgi:hypothetical protein
MINLDKAGYEVINSIHDEVLLLVEEQTYHFKQGSYHRRKHRL